jgi:hypothetical protein
VEPGTSERHPPEGRRLVLTDPGPRPAEIERWVRWSRTIVVEGPEDWIETTRMGALADGIHRIGPGGRIYVETTELDYQRHHDSGDDPNPITNTVLKRLHDEDPDAYDAIHGAGTADRGDHTVDPDPTPPTDPATGGYI